MKKRRRGTQMKQRMKVLAVAGLASVLSACATSPTGRNQVLLYSETQMAEMGGQAFSSMKEELKVGGFSAVQGT